MRLTKEQIEDINRKAPSDQGIFVQPYGIPVNIKTAVVYCRYKTGGTSGGNWCDNSNPRRYTEDPPEDKMEILDIVLRDLKPAITYLEYKALQKLIHTNEEIENEYYGNSTDYLIEYIVLSELYDFLNIPF